MVRCGGLVLAPRNGGHELLIRVQPKPGPKLAATKQAIVSRKALSAHRPQFSVLSLAAISSRSWNTTALPEDVPVVIALEQGAGHPRCGNYADGISHETERREAQQCRSVRAGHEAEGRGSRAPVEDGSLRRPLRRSL